MSSAVRSRSTTTSGGRSVRARPSRAAPPTPAGSQLAREPFELVTVTSQWQRALDGGQRALVAAGRFLPAAELERGRRELELERKQAARALARLAAATGVRPAPWLSPVPVTPTMLGLQATGKACLFDLDGVLTDSAVLHSSAWAEVFDDYLLRLSEKTGWHFIPFDRDSDYRGYVDGRLRIEGIHAFLASRGLRIPEGRVDDPATADTACGLARRKGDAVARGLRRQGVAALPGVRRYLEAAGHAGLGRAVVSSSTSTLPMLELAGLVALVEERVDAEVIRLESLRTRPAPDLLLVACRRLGVPSERAVTVTHSAAGVAAGHAAGLSVIGVGVGGHAELLRGFGAERVVPSLSAMLDPRLTVRAAA